MWRPAPHDARCGRSTLFRMRPCRIPRRCQHSRTARHSAGVGPPRAVARAAGIRPNRSHPIARARAITVCAWRDSDGRECMRPTGHRQRAYCARHRPYCAVPGCRKRAESDRLECTVHRRDRKLGGRQPKHHAPLPAACTVADCPRRPVARGWCMTHWRRWRRTGSVADPERLGTCRYDSAPASRRMTDGTPVCLRHYRRWATYGDPLTVRKLVNAGQVCANGDGRAAFRRGLCVRCYWREYATPARVARRNLATAKLGT